MKRTFIIDGQIRELTVKRMVFRSDLVDITPVGKRWREWTASGEKWLELSATADDGTEVKGIFG